MKSTINVSNEHLEGIIKDLDKSDFFLLSNEKASRTDLFNFALALGLSKGEPTKLTSSKGLIRTSNEDVKPYFFMYKSIYYDKVILNTRDIDMILDMDAVFDLVEQYANTGFCILSRMKSEFRDSNQFSAKLLSEIGALQEEYLSTFSLKKVYTE